MSLRIRNCIKHGRTWFYRYSSRNTKNGFSYKCKKCQQHRDAVRPVRNRKKLRRLPPVAQAVRSPTSRDLLWAAGFLEGEGNFQYNGASPRAKANQVNKEPLCQLQAIFGGTLRLERRKAPNNDIWEWYVYGATARGVMLTLFQFMSQKRQQQIVEAINGVRN